MTGILRTVMCSGGFDPLHAGHLDYLEAAHQYGPVVVVLNSDAWLVKKKGYCFMPWADRARILMALRCVNNVLSVDDQNGTVVRALFDYHPIYFANGGDRTEANPDEDAVCEELNIKQLFGIGGDKVASSSEMVDSAFLAHRSRKIKQL